jgi:molybdenum cofactor cytidylyltransferase
MMSRALGFCGVILAAGESTRMGTEKALLPWPPLAPGQPLHRETFLSAAIRSLGLSTDQILVVVGRNEAALAPVAYANGASVIVNPDPGRGQFSSLQAGLREVLNLGRDAAMITLVDRPPVSTATIQRLREVFEAAPNEIWAVVPEFSGAHGHPMIAGREMIEAFLQAPPAATARDVEHRHQPHIEYLPVAEPFIAVNVNTPEEYARLSSI